MKQKSLAVFMAVAIAPLGQAVADESPPAKPVALTTQFTFKATVPEVPAETRELRIWLPVPSNSE
ncbi:MAG: hypothetical protein M3347_14545 [Armatimonadota bacterium]|nr:hypothetical protein [Armatimonadota bacterium]